MPATDLRYRQVHLDFHTSEHIARIGADFDAELFAGVLSRAQVDSVTCFARCHHGWIYYDTTNSPERRHPHLQRDLLREQIQACHAQGIRVPVYITVQWDHYTAEHHPEWLCVTPAGQIQGTPPYEAGFYRKLCINTPYVEWLKAHVQEILDILPVDGLFFDIVQPNDCSCAYCRREMLDRNLDPADAVARQEFGRQTVNRFKQDMTRFVRQSNADCTLFYNAGHVGPRHRAVAGAYTHWELESLPSGGWGYLHFPLTMRYARTLGLDCLGMTGKFHTSWGDFHSFKNLSALEFECFQMLALNARCSIGDQLHPEGRICEPTYALIGAVYSQVKAREPWCRDAEPVTEIGVYHPEEFTGGHISLPQSAMGAVRMLQEGGHQFDLVDTATALEPYRLVVLPEAVPLTAGLRDRLDRFVADGGAVIAAGNGGLDEDGRGMGVRALGAAPFSPDFVLPSGPLGKGLADTAHVMYQRGLQVEPDAGAEVLAWTELPYFERHWRHFCSHRHTPSAGRQGYPAVVRQGRTIHFAHPIFSQYARNAPRWCKQLFLNALDLLLPDPLVRVVGPSTLLTALNRQGSANRLVLHLLHYIPERRGADFDVVEDVIPLYDLRVSIRVTGVAGVSCVPQREKLEWMDSDGRVEFTVPAVQGHQMVEIELD